MPNERNHVLKSEASRVKTPAEEPWILADIGAFGLGYILLSIAHWRLRTKASEMTAFRLDAPERKRLTRYAVFNHLNDASSLLVYGQTDNFFIASMLSPVAVAAYAFYARLTEMINNLIPQKLFDNVIQPMFFSVPAAEADVRLSRYFTLLIDLNLALQLPAIAFAIVYHSELVQVFFAGKYLQYSSLFPLVLALSIVPSSMSIIETQGLCKTYGRFVALHELNISGTVLAACSH